MGADTQEELIARINKHLPPIDYNLIFEGRPPDHIGEWPDDAEGWLLNFFSFATRSPTGYLDVWKHKDEEVKLDEIRRTIIKLERLWNSLPESIEEEMVATSIELAEELSEGDGYHRCPSFDEIFGAFKEPNFLKEIFKSGRDAIRRGYPLGRRKWQAVCVVDACREIWHRRTGDKAPMNVKPTSPFGKFVIDVFDGLGLEDDPLSATQSWQKVHSKYIANAKIPD